MMRFLKYRPVIVVLVTLFCIFNIGVPVVIAACPMSEQGGGGACGLCYPSADDGLPGYLPNLDRSCCETVLVSEGSGAEFLKAPGAVPVDGNVLFVTAVTPPDLAHYSFSSRTVRPAERSPGGENLPILLSSLLL